MKKQASVFCVILGFLLLVFLPLAAQEEPGPAPVPGQGPGPEGRLAKWLELTPEQQAKLKDMRTLRQEAMKGLHEQQAKLQKELEALMEEPKADQKKVEGLIDEMAKLQASRMKSNFQFRQDMAKVLTPQQLEKLQKGRTALQGIRGGLRFLKRHPGARRFMDGPFFGRRGFNRPGRMGFRHPGTRDRMFWQW